MNRNIVEVIEQVKNALPVSWVTTPFLKEKLIYIQLQARQTPRAPHEDLWEEVAGYLSSSLDPVDVDWKRKILKVWIGKTRLSKGDIHGLDKPDPGHGGTPWTPGE